MRIKGLELRDYRGFERLNITFEAVTVLVGPNDAGKSTILDALRRVLLWETDVLADGDLAWADVAYHPDGLSPWEHGRERPVTVCVKFDALTTAEERAWGPVVSHGCLRLGRLWRSGGSSRLPYLVLDDLARGNLIRAVRAMAVSGDPDVYEDELTGAIQTIDDEHWIDMEDIFDFPWGENGLAEAHNYLPPAERTVYIPGAEAPIPAPATVMGPLLRSMLRRRLAQPGAADDAYKIDLLDPVAREARAAAEEVSGAFDRLIGKYAAGAAGGAVSAALGRLDHVLDSILGEIAVTIERWDDRVATEPGRRSERRSVRLEAMGSGTRRAALLASLELYRDPDLWSPDRSVTILVDEPEMGLHPGAQRRVAQAIADLPTYGLQALVVTHSSIFVGVVPLTAIRLVRTVREPGERTRHSVILPDRLAEVADSLEIEPRDILMARRFIVLEGPADVAVFGAWARTLALDPASSGCRFIVAGGESRTSSIAQLLDVIYEGASVIVVLDGGGPTVKREEVIRKQFGDQIEVVRLANSEIEAYFPEQGVLAWLTLSGVTGGPDLENEVRGRPITKRLLKTLATRHLRRYYDVVNDGATIARLMREQDIAAELRGLLVRLLQ